MVVKAQVFSCFPSLWFKCHKFPPVFPVYGSIGHKFPPVFPLYGSIGHKFSPVFSLFGSKITSFNLSPSLWLKYHKLSPVFPFYGSIGHKFSPVFPVYGSIKIEWWTKLRFSIKPRAALFMLFTFPPGVSKKHISFYKNRKCQCTWTTAILTQFKDNLKLFIGTNPYSLI